jgi:hypothetical protein
MPRRPEWHDYNEADIDRLDQWEQRVGDGDGTSEKGAAVGVVGSTIHAFSIRRLTTASRYVFRMLTASRRAVGASRLAMIWTRDQAVGARAAKWNVLSVTH